MKKFFSLLTSPEAVNDDDLAIKKKTKKPLDQVQVEVTEAKEEFARDTWDIVLLFADKKSHLKLRMVSKELKNKVDNSEIWKTSILKFDNQFLRIHGLSWFENHLEIKKKEKAKLLEFLNFELDVPYMHRACSRPCPPPKETRKKLKHTFHKVGGFTSHPDDNESLTISMKAVTYLSLAAENLIILEKNLEYKKDEFLKDGMIRYKMFMDLKAKYPDEFLVPTIDIECIWMSHLIRPIAYQKDCKKLYGRIIDHRLTSRYDSMLIENALKLTEKLWKDTYNEEYGGKLGNYYSDKVLFVNYEKVSNYQDVDNPFSFTFDEIKKDRTWYGYYTNFMSKYYDESESINQLDYQIKSYERFMYMNAVHPDIQGHPSYAIDLIWHTHMAHPLDYVDDCENVVGFLVDHAPWPKTSDDNCQKKYAKLWEEEFSGNPLLKDHMLTFD